MFTDWTHTLAFVANLSTLITRSNVVLFWSCIRAYCTCPIAIRSFHAFRLFLTFPGVCSIFVDEFIIWSTARSWAWIRAFNVVLQSTSFLVLRWLSGIGFGVTTFILLIFLALRFIASTIALFALNVIVRRIRVNCVVRSWNRNICTNFVAVFILS